MRDASHLIVTVSRNDSKCISRLIPTIMNQSLRPQQWIIVDDSSSDDTYEKIHGVYMYLYRRFGGVLPATPQIGKYSVRGVREIFLCAMVWSRGCPQRNSVLLLLLLLLRISVFLVLFFVFLCFSLLFQLA